MSAPLTPGPNGHARRRRSASGTHTPEAGESSGLNLSDRRVLAGLAAGVVAIAGLGYFLVLPALAGPATPAATPAATAPRLAHPGTPSTTGKTGSTSAASASVSATGADAIGRDPFTPLVSPSAAPTPTPSPSASSAPAASSGTTTGSPAVSSARSGAAPAGTTQVALVGIVEISGKPAARTAVNGQPYTSAVGQIFDTDYQVQSISGSCATYLYGDAQFALCSGQYIDLPG